ncbi:dolichol-phosphate mannosyltransferase subunit 3 [Episyrphus balteatus]|uniref:dolichol-phosphate mannosyltransferase subunit 3 n=1 Tax=Episyrphus balteatus TaxID=286459 RepID=UPI002486928F|nr:dolichol-phosphate mannosyltransferase subunit 3 [Episyrphus balteatus]
MTNLMRWLMYIGIFAVPYICIVSGQIRTNTTEKYLFEIQIFPILLILLFGLYATTTVTYRTLTFNDCPEASKELHDEIEEARRDLTSKGFKFRD